MMQMKWLWINLRFYFICICLDSIWGCWDAEKMTSGEFPLGGEMNKIPWLENPLVEGGGRFSIVFGFEGRKPLNVNLNVSTCSNQIYNYRDMSRIT